jgi:hypothetical protein
MRKAVLPVALAALAMLLVFPHSNLAQNREKFVISARAGGVNAVTGRASMRPHGNAEWQQLTIKEDLEAGDVVKTGLDGRVEMLLNPGSYLRVGENSEFELADNSLDNLEVRLVRGTAIVEVTGADDEELFIGITTPHTRMSIIRRGLYRVNVVPGDTTELIVRKGRVILEGSHTKVKGGNKVVFSAGSFSVAKLTDAEKNRDDIEVWSKVRAQTLAKANNRIPGRQILALAANLSSDWTLNGYGRRGGFWWYNADWNCYTMVPFNFGWSSPYGGSYSSSFYGGFGGFGGRGTCFGCTQRNGLPVTTGNNGNADPGSGATSAPIGRSTGVPSRPVESPAMNRETRELSPAAHSRVNRPDN